MTFFYAFNVAGFLLVGYGALAFRYARVLCAHLLILWVYFIGLPLATAWLYAGQMTGHTIIGSDLASADLAAAITQHAHLYILYGLGLFVVAVAFRDAQVFRDIQRVLAQQRFNPFFLILFALTLGAKMLLAASFGVFIVGSSSVTAVLDIPYVVTSLISLLDSLNYGLFCYLCIFSARPRALLAPCSFYLAYLLVSEGRRAMLVGLLTLFILRRLSLGFNLSWRLVWITAGALTLFILVGPIYLEAREIALNLQSAGYSPIAALFDGSGQAFDNFLAGKTGFSIVADNVAQRASAGVFFLNVVTRQFEFQHGGLTWTSIIWMIPSVFVDKPPLQAEQMIQLLAHQALVDDASSIQLILYADFGPLGLFLAGIYTALLLYAVAKILARSGQFNIFKVVLLGTFFSLSMAIEMELSGQFVMIRNALILAPISLLANFLSGGPRRRTHRPLPARPLQRRSPLQPAASLAARARSPTSLAP